MIEVFIDGACAPFNPYGDMGIGVLIKENDEILFSHSDFIARSKNNSNNVAEYMALEIALAWLRFNEKQNEHILLNSDSDMLLKQMFGEWRIKFGMYKETALRCKDKITVFENLVLRWIPREINIEADELSKALMPEQWEIEQTRNFIRTPRTYGNPFSYGKKQKKFTGEGQKKLSFR